jgi:hypothetical protein
MIAQAAIRARRASPMRRALSTVLLAVLGACAGTTTTPRPVVYYTIDAPLCGMKLGAVFSIDGREVGTDTFVVHLAGEHITAGPFSTSVGRHVLSAHSLTGYLWPERTVNLMPGAAFTDSLPFYCS